MKKHREYNRLKQCILFKTNEAARRFFLFCSVMFVMIMATGCGDLVEIQDRDFVLAVGLSYEAGEYVLTYALPDLAAMTGQDVAAEQKAVTTWRGRTVPEIEEDYNLSADKRLDYSFLKAIILDESISDNRERLREFLGYIENNYEIGRNTLIFYTDGTSEELLSVDQNVGGSVGTYLENLFTNNAQKRNIKPVTAGDFINCLYNKTKLLIVPGLFIRDESIVIRGGTIFHDSQMVLQLDEEVLEYINLAKGEGENYILKLSNKSIIRVKQMRNKLNYQIRDDKPYIKLAVHADAVIVQGDSEYPFGARLKKEAESNIKNRIVQLLEFFMKENHIDILNLYENSSLKSRQIWLNYRNKRMEFLDELTMDVTAEVLLQ